MVKVLLTGASGLLGRGFLRVLKEQCSTVEYLGLAFSRFDKYKDQYNLVKCDLYNQEELKKVISNFKPNVIIHCAAERKPDICENDKDKTFKLNVECTESLSNLAKEFGAYLFLISTDYVFDGKNPPYQVTSETSPISYYGLTKRDSENVSLKSNPENLVLRVPILYGQIENYKESAVTVITEQVILATTSEKKIEIDNWQVRYPTLVDDVARVSLQLIKIKSISQQDKEISGIFHFSAQEQSTKYLMAKEIAKILKVSDDNIIPGNSQPAGAPRPHNAQLDISHTRDILKKYGEVIHFSNFNNELANSITNL